MPADLAERTHTFFFFLRARRLGERDRGARRVLGLSPLDHMLEGYALNLLNLCTSKYYPRVTILSPHLTEIIPLYDHLRQPQKQVQTHHLLVTVCNSPNSPRAEQPANNRQLRVVAIDFFWK